MVWQQNGVAAELGDRIPVQVIRMAMREPCVAAAPDVLELLSGDLVGHPPAAEIGTALDPGIGGQDRVTVETGHRGVADCLKADHSITSWTTGFSADQALRRRVADESRVGYHPLYNNPVK